MAPQYKLTYFNARAVAEPIRLILAYAGAEYEDVRFEKEQWPEIKPTMPWGQVPVLEVDGIQIAQSKAIARYLARKYGLVGASEIEGAKCDEYVDALDDIRNETVKWWTEQDPKKKEEVHKKLVEEVFPKFYNKFQAIIDRNDSGYLVGNKITWADIQLANMVEQMGQHFQGVDLAKFPGLQKFVERVMGEPNIRKWIEVRPQTQY